MHRLIRFRLCNQTNAARIQRTIKLLILLRLHHPPAIDSICFFCPFARKCQRPLAKPLVIPKEHHVKQPGFQHRIVLRLQILVNLAGVKKAGRKHNCLDHSFPSLYPKNFRKSNTSSLPKSCDHRAEISFA